MSIGELLYKNNMIRVLSVVITLSLIVFLIGSITTSEIESTNNDDTLSNRTLDSEKRPTNRMSLASFTKLEKKTSRAKVRCGHAIETNDMRITDGKQASIAEFPWIISLQRERSFWFGFKAFSHSCGASLITPSWLITAAHCFYNKEGLVRAVAGVDNLNFLYRAQMRTVDKVIIHPEFDLTSYDNDITLLKVNRPFNLETTFSHVRPICLERNIPVDPYDIASIAGFGAKAYHKGSSTHLYKTEIAIIDQQTCNQSFNDAITDNMICAGGMISRKRDACAGDSGGPLLLENDDHLTLVGIVSFGVSCATQGYPGIYTRLNNYYDWVLQNIDEPLYDP